MFDKCKARRPRRGIAMLLVLVSLSMATVLAVSYLASRDNSADIGENISNAAEARWASAAGLDLGTAILQTEIDWRNSHVNGKLIDDLVLGPALLDIDLWDVPRNRKPDNQTSLVRVTSTARVGSIDHTSTALVRMLGAGVGGAADIDLSEFAIFTEGSIQMDDGSTLTRWPVAPLAALGERVAIGTRAEAASSVVIGPFAAAIDATVYRKDIASDNLVSVGNTLIVEEVEMLDGIPSPTPAQPPVAAPDPMNPMAPALFEFGATTLSADYRAGSINVNQATLTLQGNINVVSDTSIILDPGTLVIVDGNVRLVAFDDLILNAAAIELKDPDDSLEIYVFDKFTSNNSYLGEARLDDVRDVSGTAPWIDPERIVLNGFGTNVSWWELKGDSVLKGSIYAPQVDFRLEDMSALYGRVTAGLVRLSGVSALFYDPALDSGFGYKNIQGPLFLDDGHLHNSLLTLASFESADLTQLATDLDYSVTCNGGEYDSTNPEPPPPPPASPGQPTPRSVLVEYEIESVGFQVDDWEGDVG